MVVVGVLPIVHEGPVEEEPVGIFGLDEVGAPHFAVQPGGAGLDVVVADALVEHVVMERSRTYSTNWMAVFC